MEIVDQIRQVANIVEIASAYTNLKRRGKKFVGLCPFHSEKDPSFTVDDEKQLFHCFGCGQGGDVFTLIMEKENLDFPEAMKFLAQKYNIPLPQQRSLSPQAQKLEEKLLKINEMALAFFRRNLSATSEGKKALEYLKKRDFSEETIQELKIGYALNSWNSLLSHFQGRNIPSSLVEKAGLAVPGQKKNELYDRFRGRIIFPIFNLTGKVVAFGGRTVVQAEPKYLNSPDTPVYSKGKILYGLNFTKEAIRQNGELVLVEGYTDFASLYQAGIKNCAASLGTSLTSEQAFLAMRFSQKIIINYDGDSAGKMATSRAISILFEKGMETNVLILPENLDPDSFLKRYGKSRYEELTKSSVPLVKFLIDCFKPEKESMSVGEKIKVAQDIIRVIQLNPNTLAGGEYLKKLAEYLSIEEQLLRDTVRRKQNNKKTERERELLLPAEKRLLLILIENGHVGQVLVPQIKDEDFKGLMSESIFRFIRECYRKEGKFVLHGLNQSLAPPIAGYLSQLLMEESTGATVEEALDCLHALRKISLQNRLRELQEEIVRLERKGERERLTSLLSLKQDLIKQLISM